MGGERRSVVNIEKEKVNEKMGHLFYIHSTLIILHSCTCTVQYIANSSAWFLLNHNA